MRKKIILAVALLAVIALAAYYVKASRDAAALHGSGTVEARNIRVGSKVAGRVAEVKVREGDRVQAGQVLVTFEDQELLAALDQARANLAKLERGYRPEEIAEARAATGQAEARFRELESGYRKEQVAAARAELQRAKAQETVARQTYDRVANLANQDVFSKQQRDDATAAYHTAQAAVKAAEEQLAQLERGYRPEEVAAAKAAWQQAVARENLVERGYRVEDIAIARAALLDAETRYRERQVIAPADAAVEVLDIRPGDVLAANAAVATLLERDQIFVRIYIPETEIGRVRVGQKATLTVDSFPDRTFDAEIEQINQKSEFLPRNVQTRAERVHEVFGVKLRIVDPKGEIRPGMAADVRVIP